MSASRLFHAGWGSTFLVLLSHFQPVFTAPTFLWDSDHLHMLLAKLLARMLCPCDAVVLAVDDTLCRKRGSDLFGAGMQHDPLVSRRGRSAVRWGHDWVVLCIVIVHPFWAPTKVFALPIAGAIGGAADGAAAAVLAGSGLVS